MQEPHHSSPAQVPHCFYCDAVTAWFLCDCPSVKLIREGKRLGPKVKMIEGRTVIIHDPALMPLVEKIGRYGLYRDHRGVITDHGKGDLVITEGVSDHGGDHVVVNVIVNATPDEQRRAKVAEATRRWRERQKEGK